MRYRLMLKATLVVAMGITALVTPQRAAAREMCYTCSRDAECSEIEGQALCETMGGDLCPVLRTCEWPSPMCASNEVLYTCMAAP